jgi:methionyl-tRNA formyltransferase
MIESVLFFGRKNCPYSYKLKRYLKNKTKKLFYVESKKIKEKIKLGNYLKRTYSYIICFRSHYILKKNLINKAKNAAINFHPGTPKYRGIGCINYALYEDTKFYGSTCHLINETIDSGKILSLKKFKVLKKDTIESALQKTYKIMLIQAKEVIRLLDEDKKNLNIMINKNKKIKWSKKIKTLKELNKFYEIRTNSSKSEIKRKIRATYTKLFKPYTITKGKKIIYYK